jgi:hypothetical protein
MSANGISTLSTKAARVAAKLALAQAKRAAAGTIGYRALHTLDNPQVTPPRPDPLPLGRPWK